MTNTAQPQYNRHQLACAVSDARSGLGAKEAARRHQVPVEAIERALKPRPAATRRAPARRR